jgi:hypothetical protein
MLQSLRVQLSMSHLSLVCTGRIRLWLQAFASDYHTLEHVCVCVERVSVSVRLELEVLVLSEVQGSQMLLHEVHHGWRATHDHLRCNVQCNIVWYGVMECGLV